MRKDMRVSMKSKYLIDASSGIVYIPVEDPIITDLPEPIEIRYFTCIHTRDEMKVLSPGTKVVDVSCLNTIDTDPSSLRDLSFDTELPVIYDCEGKTYLLSGNPPDSSYNLMDTYVEEMNDKDEYIPTGEKYLNIDLMIIADYDTDGLPYRKFCMERGIKHVRHFSTYEKIEPKRMNEDIDLIIIE